MGSKMYRDDNFTKRVQTTPFIQNEVESSTLKKIQTKARPPNTKNFMEN